ncbi:hypothetical protein DRO59_07710 [Candidatus Bathyarchaeota archaeon]|nr:MAG: hypothetical protein DRO59_07710 [Candidatus Bathyarchaeota archaeon]
MESDVYSFALKETLNEIRNVCPDINNAFVFKENREVVVGDEETSEKTVMRVVNAFDGIFEKADAIGNIESVTLECSKGRVNVSLINDDFYLLTVTSKKADINYVNTVTRVIVPTVLRLLEKIYPASLKSSVAPSEIELAASEIEEPVEQAEGTITPEEETLEEEIKPEPLLPETPVNQLIVENLGGLLVPSDTVRIDKEILSQWEELYEEKKINMVEIETFDGKITTCKVKPIKDSKYEGKGIIRMPEKIQLTLEIKRGELVRVKPVID